MDTLYFLSRFFYRIRFPLIFGTAIVAVMTFYFTQFLPKMYVVTTTVFTGITSRPSLDDPNASTDWNFANNAHDNIINLVRSKSTLQSISVSLIAQALIHGDPNKDTKYISAQHFRRLMKVVPEDLLPLVDKNSFENTVANLTAYRTEDQGNFIYAIFNWTDPYYSYFDLSKIKIRRMQASDMIEISYECDDQGIASNTLIFLNQELAKRWEGLMLSASNDVVKHFEEQLAIADAKLRSAEDTLVAFNTANGIINYEEQTKHLAALNNIFESNYDDILRENKSSRALLDELEQQMDIRLQLIKENETFLQVLDEISTLNGKIAEIEIFGGSDEAKNVTLEAHRQKLRAAEARIREVSMRMDTYKQSKEGVAITDMADKWLSELMKYNKSSSELKVMDKRREELKGQYDFFSPVGPNLNRLDRTVRVAEESYLTILHHLGLAKLKQKNIMLNSGTLQVVTPPEYPLLSVPRKRELYLAVAVVGALVFISAFFLLLEMLDRTLRNKWRTENFTGGKVIGAMPQKPGVRFRRYADEIQRMATSFLANQINERVCPTQTVYVNVLSIDRGEGKTFVSENLASYWEEMGFSVRIVSYEADFVTGSKEFLTSKSVADLLPKNEVKTDFVITEFDALKMASAPAALLKAADMNLMVLNAEKPWKGSDKTLFEDVQRMVNPERLAICLSRADRGAVEEIVGQLPPYSKWRTLFYKWFNFGISARSA